MHQGGRAAAVEVDGAPGAQRRHQRRELAQREARLVRERPSQATASSRPRVRPRAARGWRPSQMSESNWALPGREALGVVAVAHDRRGRRAPAAARPAADRRAGRPAGGRGRRAAPGGRPRRRTSGRGPSGGSKGTLRRADAARSRAPRAACRRASRRSRRPGRRPPRPAGTRPRAARARSSATTRRATRRRGYSATWTVVAAPSARSQRKDRNSPTDGARGRVGAVEAITSGVGRSAPPLNRRVRGPSGPPR